MAAKLTTSLLVQATATLTDTLALGSKQAPQTVKYPFTWPSGTGANAADLVWSDTRTLAASTSENLDLAGVLAGAFGATLTFARIRGLIVAAAGGNANDVIVGGAASNGFISWVGAAAHTLTVRPGGVFALIAPGATAYTVAASTADLLKIANSGAATSVTYSIMLIGASA